VIRLGEVGPQQRHRGERERPRPQVLANHRIRANRARRLDAMVRRVLGKVEAFGAVGEERAAALGEVEATRVHLGEHGDEGGRRLAFAGGEPRDLREEVAIGQVRGDEITRRHTHNIGPRLSTGWLDAGCPNAPHDTRAGPSVPDRGTRVNVVHRTAILVRDGDARRGAASELSRGSDTTFSGGAQRHGDFPSTPLTRLADRVSRLEQR
jgi:hypothetical protein